MNCSANTLRVLLPILVGLIASIVTAGSPSAQLLHPAPAASVASRGESTTLLADGRMLQIGDLDGAPSAVVRIADANSGLFQQQPYLLPTARYGASATVMPNGRVLILGGVDSSEHALADAVLIDTSTGSVQVVAVDGFEPRAFHTATLLTDGTLLVAGGVNAAGVVMDDGMAVDTDAWVSVPLGSAMIAGRFAHAAGLLPDDSVLLWGGLDTQNRPDLQGSMFDPASGEFFSLTAAEVAIEKAPLDSPNAVGLAGGIPAVGAIDFPIDARVSVRFTQPIAPESLNGQTVTLFGPSGAVTATVVGAQDGMLLFVSPERQLLPASDYTLFISGAVGRNGKALPFSAVSFHTSALGLDEPRPSTLTMPQWKQRLLAKRAQSAATVAQQRGLSSGDASPKVAPGVALIDDEEWIPGPQNFTGNWRTGRPAPILTKAAPTPPQQGTSLSGQVLRLNGKPLQNVTLAIGGVATKSDADGYFVLSGIAAGSQTLVIDGASANRSDATYGYFESLTRIESDKANTLAYTIWMPKLDTTHVFKLASPTTEEVVLSTPRIPGFEVHIPAGVVIRDRAGRAITSISVTAVPVDRTPFPQPSMEFPVYYTVQPGGAVVEALDGQKVESARIVYPNYGANPAGTPASFWLYDPHERGWYIYDQGAVSKDGTKVEPLSAVGLYEFTGGGYYVGPTPGPPAAPPCESCPCAGGGGSPPGCGGNGPPGGPDPGWGGGAGNPGSDPLSPSGGDPVDLSTGSFVHSETDLSVADVETIDVARVYRHNNLNLGAFGIGTSTPHDMYVWSSDTTNYSSLVVVLSNGTQIPYTRTSGGTGLAEGATFQHTGSPSVYLNSKITIHDTGTGHPDYVLTMLDGRTLVFFHHGGKLVSYSDRDGNTTTINRSGDSGPITSVVGPTGRYIQFVNNADGTVHQISDVLGRTYTYVYTNQYLTSVTDPESGVRNYTYDTNNRMRTIQDPNGNLKVTIDYDPNNRTSKQTFSDSSTMQFAYTVNGSGIVTAATVADQFGYVRNVTFDTHGYITSSTYPVGSALAQTTTFARDPVTSLRLQDTDALGRVTTYTYDTYGNRTGVTRLSGTANAATYTYTFGAFRSLTTLTDPLGHQKTYAYDTSGHLLAVHDALGNAMTFQYDERGRAISFNDSIGNTTRWIYVGADMTQIVDPMGRTTTLGYDGVGRAISVTSPKLGITTATYDKLDHVTQITDSVGNVTKFLYDGNGNIKKFTDSLNNQTQFFYNNLSKLASRTDGLAHTETTAYDGASRVSQFTDRIGQVSGQTFDARGRVSQVGFGATVASPMSYQSSINYVYDAADRVTQILDSANGAITRSYDGFDRIMSEQSPQGTVNYTYDAAGRRATMTVTGQPTTTYTYDNADRLTSIQSPLGTASFTLDPNGRRVTTTLPNGLIVANTYDAAGAIAQISYVNAGVTVGARSYSFDPNGNVSSIAYSGIASNLNIPSGVSDAAYNAANQLTMWNGQTLAYDLNGNTLSDGTNTYTWDERGHLRGISGPVPSNFAYDGTGRRQAKIVAGSTTKYLFDGDNAVQEQSGSGTVNANLVTGFRVDDVLARMSVGGSMYSFLSDNIHSTIALVDGQGLISDQYSYDPFGASSHTLGTNGNARQFSGRDAEPTGLTYFRARYQSQQTGRFISEDPIGLAGGSNEYRYVDNNPINRIDPSGLQFAPSPIGPIPWPLPVGAQPPGGKKPGTDDPMHPPEGKTPHDPGWPFNYPKPTTPTGTGTTEQPMPTPKPETPNDDKLCKNFYDTCMKTLACIGKSSAFAICFSGYIACMAIK